MSWATAMEYSSTAYAATTAPTPSSSPTPNAVFSPIISTVKAGTSIPLYLPAYVADPETTVYAQVLSLSSSGYLVEINRQPGCGNADVCDEGFVAGFSPASAPPYSGTVVTLSNGTHAYYTPAVCAGAGCTRATLLFPIAGNIYEIAVKAGKQAELLQIANSLVGPE